MEVSRLSPPYTLDKESFCPISLPSRRPFTGVPRGPGPKVPQRVLLERFWSSVGHGEVRVYRGTGVSRGVRRTTWDRSLKNWELQIPCFEEFFWGGNTLGLVPASLPHTLGYACTFYAPTSPPPNLARSAKECSLRGAFGVFRGEVLKNQNFPRVGKLRAWA